MVTGRCNYIGHCFEKQKSTFNFTLMLKNLALVTTAPDNVLTKYGHLKNSLKGQSHEKVDELRVWGGSLGPN
jgi:hypothetical protein